jgi:hypothetical protein
MKHVASLKDRVLHGVLGFPNLGWHVLLGCVTEHYLPIKCEFYCHRQIVENSTSMSGLKCVPAVLLVGVIRPSLCDSAFDFIANLATALTIFDHLTVSGEVNC